MFGLALAALIVAYCAIVQGMAVTSAIVVALNFLWWLEVVCMVIIGLIMTGLGAGLGGASASSNGLGGGGTAAFGILGGFGGALLAILLMAIPAALSLGGIYLMIHAIGAEPSFDTVNMTNFVIGAVLYGISILMAISRRSSSSKSND